MTTTIFCKPNIARKIMQAAYSMDRSASFQSNKRYVAGRWLTAVRVKAGVIVTGQESWVKDLAKIAV